MTVKYFRITPLEQDKTFILHNVVSKDGSRRWTASQIIGSQLGYRHFENPVTQAQVDDLLIYSDPKLSGYQFDDEFDYISDYDYSFDESFSDEEQASLSEAYEGGTGEGIGAAWLDMGDHEWTLDGDEILYFKCPVKIDLIDKDGNLREEDVQPKK